MHQQTTTRPKTNALVPQSSGALAVPIDQSAEGRDAIGAELYHRFHAMKTYGKEPESLASIVKVFTSDLAGYPADKILLAIKTHSQRSQEFPTPSDIIGLINRNGRPPLTEAQFVAINRKAGEDRTDADWQFLRDWEAEKNAGWREFPDQKSAERQVDENRRLRAQVISLKAELERMTALFRQEQAQKLPEPTIDERIQKTVDWMRSTGAKEMEIEDFIASQQVLPTVCYESAPLDADSIASCASKITP